jgi:hypothetical protein
MISRIFDSLGIYFNVLGAVCRSFLANHRGNNRWIPLLPVAPAINTSLTMDKLVVKVDKTIRLVIFIRREICCCSIVFARQVQIQSLLCVF